MRALVYAYQEIGYLCLEELLRNKVEVAALITHPDDPHEEIWFPSVAKLARAHNIPVHETDEVKDPRWHELAKSYEPQLIFSFMFRRMISTDTLALAPGGAFNIHPSCLPKYRGRCPTNWALVNGETETGVTLHEMVRRADAGAIVAQERVAIGPDDDIADLYRKLGQAAPVMLARALPDIIAGDYPRLPQDEAAATKFGGRRPSDGKLEWGWPAQRIHNLVRAVAHPYPGAFYGDGDKQVFVWKTSLSGVAQKAEPGTVLELNPLRISAGEGASIDIIKIQARGGKEMTGADFAVAAGLRKGFKIDQETK
jgi:UDP-4-amino-4-deoxy-L-arabinose formyltransferase/UDP-glucuronic acid dehydrogenase (UDP-4-keto-hexauronic acid decarboxylating)